MLITSIFSFSHNVLKKVSFLHVGSLEVGLCGKVLKYLQTKKKKLIVAYNQMKELAFEGKENSVEEKTKHVGYDLYAYLP